MTDRWPALKFALFAAVCVVAAVVVAQWTGNYSRLPLVGTANVFEAELDDASGLAVGDDVRLAGVRVGRVEGLAVERGKGIVTFELDPGVDITDTWEVGARWRNVIGQRYLYLYDVEGGAPLEPGSRIPVVRARPSADLGRLFNELTPLLRAISPEQQNQLVTALNDALDGNSARIQQLVRDLGALGQTVADQEPQIRTVLVQGSELLETYEARREELQGFITELADVGATLSARNDELVGAVADIGEAQAQLGDLLEANDAEVRHLVGNLEHVTDRIRAQREAGYLEEAIATARAGLATYMLISRHGQWFDVRAVAVQVQDGHGRVLFCQTERGTACAEPNSRKASAAAGAGGGARTRGHDVGMAGTSLVPERRPALPAVAGRALGGLQAQPASTEHAAAGAEG